MAATVSDYIEQLEDQSASTRAAAARALCELGQGAAMAVPALSERVGDSNMLARLWAINALAAIGAAAAPAAARLAAALDERALFANAAMALADIGKPAADGALAALRRFLPDPGDDIRLTAKTPCASKCSRL